MRVTVPPVAPQDLQRGTLLAGAWSATAVLGGPAEALVAHGVVLLVERREHHPAPAPWAVVDRLHALVDLVRRRLDPPGRAAPGTTTAGV